MYRFKARNASRRGLAYTFGTLLLLVGALIPIIAVGASLWNNHRQSEERVQFLKRVNAPSLVTRVVAGLPPSTPLATPVANFSMDVSATPGPQPTPTPVPEPKKMPAPTHLAITAIKMDSDIVTVGVSPIDIDGQQAYIWDVAPYAGGHHFSSANPGEGENVVLSGHDDWHGEVFKNLWKVKQRDQIILKAGDKDWRYHVDQILDFPELGQPLDKRLENAAFIGTTGDERQTLVTYYPYGVDSDRIIIARPDWCSQC